MKNEHSEEAEAISGGCGLTITTAGTKLFGTALGKQQFVNEFVAQKVSGFVREVETLAKFAVS